MCVLYTLAYMGVCMYLFCSPQVPSRSIINSIIHIASRCLELKESPIHLLRLYLPYTILTHHYTVYSTVLAITLA
jgi:hypothetical protein